ncbi:hypothetical protein [Xenorhabdus bovienii]|uniref:hypothetical protein n=1 Tax=Xenorhabdus bovienii TaxID=40576 RepID=UPI0023B2F0BA|nr:hypothetical protein [Xenorhabdus bovienii]MDE9433878.1 DNA circularization N-terminal domain-containing protein [Xenorhabdus bovienii]MDE9440727.1 DNA circularization N-terminal domain-containing protein [Xenorhabdus bovienii]MDE9491555.1 DNA circularization N-terminal domain-containing protein [Xenorhabdus bovienii]MDE9507848.1 DNA circularization N-terminal domain-containing protein [Xenorhabdus bovienii]MDE9548742.1 DNA circularization N-terminal domain-containing protein [Xenorhabdus b
MQSSLLKRAMVDLSIASSKSLIVRLDHLLLFLVKSVLGRRQAVEYLYRDTAWIEDLG